MPSLPGAVPVARKLEAWLTRAESRLESRLTSTCWPRPVVFLACSAARMPTVASLPVSTSTSATPDFIGVPPELSGSPVIDMRPPTACTRKSYPGRCAPPPLPKPLIEQYTARGLSAATSSKPRPKRLSAPGRKFSTNTSARDASSRASARSCGSARSSVTDSLPRFALSK